MPPRPPTIRLYQADLRELPPLAELEACATPERRVAARALRDPAARLRSLAAGYLLHRAFGLQTYARGPHGKPFLPNGPHFSLSHSHERVLLIVADTPCGCDIEFHRPDRPFTALAARMFHPDAYADFVRLGATPALFYRYWTLGEAYIKATGLGIAHLPPSTFHHSAEPPFSLLHTPEPNPSRWSFSVHEDLPHYTYALALAQ